ncbi:methyltransferase-like protein 27 [Actinia tenebrosa]|uniref:Methyltransferase-like protein 27 n=1 Tax=Actinia tenebrosa TaxID=6105 RepID=A0A6P8HDS8_ACTTE|nr:methyltransferase-like protein 27 [Actinia tenebrosa]
MQQIHDEADHGSYNGSLDLSKLALSSNSEKDVKELYNRWAKDYDKDANFYGYVSHKTCADIFNVEMTNAFGNDKQKMRILDVGAGTGIIGQHLKELGYTGIDGLDISQKMLNIARDKGIYKNLICAALSEKKIDQIQTGYYDALISSGTITVGHVLPPALDEIVRLVKPGGVICFSIRVDVHDSPNYGYKEKMDELLKARKWTLVKKQPAVYHTNVGERVEYENCYIFAYRIL